MNVLLKGILHCFGLTMHQNGSSPSPPQKKNTPWGTATIISTPFLMRKDAALSAYERIRHLSVFLLQAFCSTHSQCSFRSIDYLLYLNKNNVSCLSCSTETTHLNSTSTLTLRHPFSSSYISSSSFRRFQHLARFYFPSIHSSSSTPDLV